MRTLTRPETAEWCIQRGIALDERGSPARPVEGLHYARFKIPDEGRRHAWFCNFIEASLRPRDWCLMWVPAWGIWPSSENWHLYYRLRQSYGDGRLLHEAPGHLFLDYEGPDLVSFLQIGLVAGWDIHLLPTTSYGRAFVCHDEWMDFAMEDPAEIDRIATQLADARVKRLEIR